MPETILKEAALQGLSEAGLLTIAARDFFRGEVRFRSERPRRLRRTPRTIAGMTASTLLFGCLRMRWREKKLAGDASAALLGRPVNRLPAAIKLKMAAVHKDVFEPLPATLDARFCAR
jgi:hypothetical protein